MGIEGSASSTVINFYQAQHQGEGCNNSYCICHVLTSLSSMAVIKEVFFEGAEALFRNIKNKTDIVDVQLSQNAITWRCKGMAGCGGVTED